MQKNFKLSKDQIRPLVPGQGACFATDYITVEGYPVRFMYREPPDREVDSGWRFMSGREDDAYMASAENLGVYDVNTIANYDPAIIPLLDSPVGAVFEKTPDSDRFVAVTDCAPADGTTRMPSDS